MKKSKILKKINIIDIIIVLVLALAFFGTINRISTSSSNNITGAKDFQVVFRVDNVRDYTVKALEKKGGIYSKETDAFLGEITDIKSEPMMSDITSLDGERKFIENPTRNTVYVTVKASGNNVNGAYYLPDKTEVIVGRNLDLITKYASTSGIVMSIK